MTVLVGCADCGRLACVCQTLAEHEEGCNYRASICCTTPIECKHGYDSCPTCDACTCSTQPTDQGSKP